MVNQVFIEKVKLGKKGQITIPKNIREEDQLKENDVFLLQHTLGGEIILTKQIANKTPEDKMLEIVMKAHSFDWRSSWEEVRKERNLDRL